jgi:phosphate transport system substrate-binding protein
MNKLLAILFTTLATISHAQTAINGAGATFPAPVYSKWASEYHKSTGIQMNYQATGSGAGIKQMGAKTVDFGGTDDPLSEEEVNKNGYYQFPVVIGGVVPVVNLKGIEAGKLVLDGKTLADIYRGNIKMWDSPAIAKLNKGINLPNLSITVVVRADASGTNAVFTDYLSQVSPEFKRDIGAGKQVSWKGGNYTAGKGNAGVAAFTQQIQGAIGYVEYAFAKQGKLAHVAMLDKKNKTVQPDNTTFAEAAKSANWNIPGMAVNLNNKDGWPITAATFLIVYKGSEKSLPPVKFFDWAFTNGDMMALELDYVPLPDKVKAQIRADWTKLALK